jgi:macrolide-specific efflux system membrane fusion protein
LGVLSVPSSAVTQRGRTFTVTLKPKVAGELGKRVNVEVGLQGDSRTEILSGLKEGDEVVLRTATSSSASNGFPTGGIPGGLPGGAAGVVTGGGGGGRGGN